jgi:glutamate dehydrogenase (NAD(P)+)
MENPWAVAQHQFDIAADALDLSSGLREVLRLPKRELTVPFPVKLDDGSIKVFTGYRIHHNTARGPTKGGIRYHPDTNLDEVRAIAEQRKVHLRTAAYLLAVQRVAEATLTRGIYP